MKTSHFMLAVALGVSSFGLAQAQSAPAGSPAPATGTMPPMGPGPGGPGHFGGGPHHGPDGGGPDARLLPPGTWWRNQDIVSRIGLSTDQQKRIDGIFLDSRVQLIHMHASLEEEQLKLDSALQATPFNQNEALAESDKIADTRASLEKANTRMLLTIRGVLNADQWTKLQAAGPRPGGPGGPPPARGDGKRSDHHAGGQGRGGRPDGDTPPPPPGI